MLLNGKSHCPDVVLFNMILHKLQSLTLQLNLCRITDSQFRWKGEEILLFFFQNAFPISSFGSFTPWGRAGVGKSLRSSVRNSSYFSNFLPGCSWEHTVACGCQSGMPVLSIHPISQLPLPPFHQRDSKTTWKHPECSM